MSFSNVLIVGANRGIGLGLVEEVLKTSSAQVFATARAPESAAALMELSKKYSKRVVILKVDMTDENSVKDAASELSKHTSHLDLAIFNAGTVLGIGPIENLKSEDLLENYNINVVGPQNLFRAFSSFVLASKSEKRTIAVMSSAAGSLGGLPAIGPGIKAVFQGDFLPLSGYASTKAGLNMLGRQWADSLEPKGVSVILVHPGAVATNMPLAEGFITVAESSEKLMKVIEKAEMKDGTTGMLSYDGSVIPW